MIFRMPTTIIQEADCVFAHRKELSALGTKALIVTGKHSSKKNGSLADVLRALEAEGVGTCVFDGVEENPSVETVACAARMGREEGADFVIGIGGGSPMDAAKAAAYLIFHGENGMESLYTPDGDDRALPVAAVPTTCGTGSEATGISVLTVHGKKTKASIPHRIFPRISLVDPKYLQFAPENVLRDTSLDALAHLLESGVNTKASPYSLMLVEEGLRTWNHNIKALLGAAPLDEQVCADLMRASTLAGMAIAHTGTSLPHAMSYPVTYETHFAHGKAVSCFLPGYLREAGEQSMHLMKLAGFESADALAAFTEVLSPRDRIPEALLERSVASVLANTEKLKDAPFAVDEQVLRRIAGLN